MQLVDKVVSVYELYDDKNPLSVRQSEEMQKALVCLGKEVNFQRVSIADYRTLPGRFGRGAFSAPNVFIVKEWKRQATGEVLFSLNTSLGGIEGRLVEADVIARCVYRLMYEDMQGTICEDEVRNLR